MTRRTVVTGGDAKYFPLIDELCASVRHFRTAQDLEVAVIDGGLTGEQKSHLAARYGARILEVGWGFDIPAARIRGRDHLKVQIARSFLDQHLPESDLIAWIDGDAWIQDISALDMMFEASALGPISIVSQSSRNATHAMHLRWMGADWVGLGDFVQVRTILYKNARRAGVKEAEARAIGDKGVLNTGVFTLRRDAPHWALWRARQEEVIRRGRVFTSDQLSLALAVYVDGASLEVAPDICNYMGPNWCCDDAGTELIERYIPNARVGVVHMAGYDDMRRSLDITAPIRTLDGRTIHRSLRRSAWVKD